jgi:hypothetical protein
MPRYFFNTLDHTQDADHVGVDLDDDHVARREAVRFAGAMMADQPDVLWDGTRFRVEVLDQDRHALFTVTITAEDARG